MPRAKKETTAKGSKCIAVTPTSLEEATYENTPAFSIVGHATKAKCVRVYDGDTAHFVFSFPPLGVGPANLCRERCRLAGYNTAEMKGETPEERACALAAKELLEKTILGQILDVEFGEYDLYGRPILTVFIPAKDGSGETTTMANYMISLGLAVAYDGRGSKLWKPAAAQ